MLDQITPVVLTYNEADNIERTLAGLDWAREIVIVDSYSNDETLALVRAYSQVRVFQRVFDSHATQWNYAIKETGITSGWILALDADYVLTRELVEELRGLAPEQEVSGYRASFLYCVKGRPLGSSIYPPVTVLYRRGQAAYSQDGHTQRVELSGGVLNLRGVIRHDDRKSFECWLRSQSRYMKLEAGKLVSSKWRDLGWADRLRKLKIIAPIAVLFYCLFVRGLILEGRAGVYYSFQRMLSELILSLNLIERTLTRPKKVPVTLLTDETQAAKLTIEHRK